MKALVRHNDNRVYEVVANQFPVHPDFQWVDCPENCTPDWAYDFNSEIFVEPVVEVKNKTQKILELRRAVNYIFDKTAQEKDYKDSLELITYQVSSFLPFKNDANIFSLWRDSVWTYVLTEIQKMENNQRSVPMLSDFLAELPVISW